MFNKDNIISVRYTNPENTNVEVIYSEEDGRNIPFYLASKPTSVPAWKILKEAGWTPSKIADSTVKWIEDQTILQYKIAEKFAQDLAEERINVESGRLKENYDSEIAEIRERYDARITDMSAVIKSTDTSSLYKLVNDLNDSEEAVFKFKLDLLEDQNNFKELTKSVEKTKRREIRKAKTLKELFKYL